MWISTDITKGEESFFVYDLCTCVIFSRLWIGWKLEYSNIFLPLEPEIDPSHLLLKWVLLSVLVMICLEIYNIHVTSHMTYQLLKNFFALFTVGFNWYELEVYSGYIVRLLEFIHQLSSQIWTVVQWRGLRWYKSIRFQDVLCSSFIDTNLSTLKQKNMLKKLKSFEYIFFSLSTPFHVSSRKSVKWTYLILY